LPVVVGTYARRRDVYSFEAGMLYGVNTLGAVTGTLAAGFLLVPWLGLLKTCLLAAAMDCLVAVLAFRIHRKVGAIEDIRHIQDRLAAGAKRSWTLSQWAIGGIFAVSGAMAMVYEVGWFRLLGLTIGPSVYAFSAMLGMFLLGIGAGSALASGWAERSRLGGIRAMALLEGLLGVVSIGGMYFFNGLPWANLKIFGIATGVLGTEGFAVSHMVLAALVVLPPCLIMGALFPVTVRAVREAGSDVAPEMNVGRLYVMNTGGGIIGSLAAGFYLVPYKGMWGMLIAAGMVSGLLGAVLWLLSSRRPWRRCLAAAAATVVLTAGLGWGAPEFNAAFYNRGLYRSIYRGVPIDVSSAKAQLLYYREGINAPVSVFNEGGIGSLRVTGKSDASNNPMDITVQLVAGHLPVLFAESPQRVAVIGYGSGMSVMAVLTHPIVESLDVMEIEEAVIEASPYFESINHNPFRDPRFRLVMEDGRIHVAYAEGIYDVIISEPSNPWMSGISNLFTVDFYRKVKSRLSPEGIFGQWLQLYEISPASVKTVLASVHEVFPHMAVFLVDDGNTIILASSRPIRRPYEEFRKRFEEERVRDSFKRVNVFHADQVLSYFIASDERVKAFVADAPSLNTDDNVWLEHRMPRDMVWSGSLAYAGSKEDPAFLLSNLDVDRRLRSIREMLPGLSLPDTMRGILRYLYSTEPEIHGPEVKDNYDIFRTAYVRGMGAEVERMGDPGLAAAFKAWNSEGSVYFDNRMQASRHVAASAGKDMEIQKKITQEAFTVAPDLPAVLTQMGFLAGRDGRYREALTYYSRVLEKPASPFYYRALMGMGDVSISIGEIEKAMEYYAKASGYNPYLPKAFLALAAVHIRQGNSGKAREILQSGLHYNPGDPRIQRALGLSRTVVPAG
ncbi:MAG: tetratricopeptide repeat protein, partial [candidate division WOR-3 bacterium]